VEVRDDSGGDVAGVKVERAPVRGTQSFVHTMNACWKRPSLTGLEVLWRWVFGIPAVLLMYTQAVRVLRENPVDTGSLRQMSLLDPAGSAVTIAQAAGVLMPPVLRVVAWLAPLLLIGWVVMSSIGRTMVLRRADPQLRARTGTLIVLQAVRIVALAGSFLVWFACLRKAAAVALEGPIAAGQPPNLVRYCALAIIATLGMFTLWAIASWAVSVAPLLAMLRNLGVGASLAAAFRLGALRSKLMEINLVMGIVKIALIVLAMVASSCPLPFESVATPDFMVWWYAGVTVVYFLASDFFHVVRQMAYLNLWKAYEAGTLVR
jgi:hypothetical protein